jgi:hypothetical protein
LPVERKSDNSGAQPVADKGGHSAERFALALDLLAQPQDFDDVSGELNLRSRGCPSGRITAGRLGKRVHGARQPALLSGVRRCLRERSLRPRPQEWRETRESRACNATCDLTRFARTSGPQERLEENHAQAERRQRQVGRPGR